MDYFKKVGRPTEEEQAVIQAIERLIAEKQVPRSEIPVCQSLDDLLEVQNLLEAYVSQNETNEVPAEDSISQASAEESEEEISADEISDQTSEPFEDAQTELNESSQQEEVEIVENSIDEQTEGTQIEQEAEPEATVMEKEPLQFVADDYDPFSDEIKERSYTSAIESEEDNQESGNPEEAEPFLSESEQTPVDNLNPNTKRKVAEQTANSILKGYAKLAPQPFKWLAKINETKIEKLAFEGQIDINLEVSEGTTFDEYMRQTNEQIDEIFEVDEDTLDEIREPLVEVLLEQKMELTPQQRLMMAVVSHLFQMFTVAIGLRRQNNRILEYQKRMTLLAAQKAA